MQTLRIITTLGILILAAGCIRSLHPIYTEKDIVFEPGLIGQWQEKGEDDVWVFSKGEDNAYKFVFTDGKGRQGAFKAHLAKIDGSLFLDFFPEKPELEENGFYQAHLLPVHTFAYVQQIEPVLQIRFPDYKWFETLVKESPDAIRHENVEPGIILSASTQELQAFWVKHLATEGAYGESSNMKRRDLGDSTSDGE
jgi:hypothetical protein